MKIAIVKISQKLPLEQSVATRIPTKDVPLGEHTLFNGLYGGLHPKGVPFFRPQEYPDKRVRISLIEVYEMVGKSLSFWSVKGPRKG